LVHKKVGEIVEMEEPLFTLHAASDADAIMAESRLQNSVSIEDTPFQPLPLFYDRIE
jgi:pyrimidine-nucleoside phosphorylase